MSTVEWIASVAADPFREFYMRFEICHLRPVVSAVESIPSEARTG
jgi:hypothetical protein